MLLLARDEAGGERPGAKAVETLLLARSKQDKQLHDV